MKNLNFNIRFSRNGKLVRYFLLLVLSFYTLSVIAEDIPAVGGTKVQRLKLTDSDKEQLSKLDAQDQFMTLLNAPEFLSLEALNEISFDVRKLAFYRFNDRQYKKFPRIFYDFIEQRMMDNFLQAQRFSVHECFECKTTKILLKEKQFSVLRQLDSNQALADVGEKIGVDSFVLWEGYMYKDEPVLNLRIVTAHDGQVVWSQQYQAEPDYEYDWEFYSSLWGLTATRASTGATADFEVSPLTNIGFRTLSRSTITDRLYYGYGLEAFFNTIDRDKIGIIGISLNAKIALEIDAVFGMKKKSYGNWLIYVSVGQALVNAKPVILSKAGLEMRLNRRSFVSIGGVYLPETTFEEDAVSGYASQSTLGGFSYDITLGFRF